MSRRTGHRYVQFALGVLQHVRKDIVVAQMRWRFIPCLWSTRVQVNQIGDVLRLINRHMEDQHIVLDIQSTELALRQEVRVTIGVLVRRIATTQSGHFNKGIRWGLVAVRLSRIIRHRVLEKGHHVLGLGTHAQVQRSYLEGEVILVIFRANWIVVEYFWIKSTMTQIVVLLVLLTKTADEEMIDVMETKVDYLFLDMFME